MGYYLLYDHFDHLLDELVFAQRAYRTVYDYVNLLEQRTEQNGLVTISTSIAVTWMRPVERIIHAARMPVDTISVALDDRSVRVTSNGCESDHGPLARWSIRSYERATFGSIIICC